MMNNETRRIDLHLPRGWSECTTEQLELIAAAIIGEQRRTDHYHPFDWTRVKTLLFFAMTGLEICRTESTEEAATAYIVRFSRQSRLSRMLRYHRSPTDYAPFPIYAWQVQACIEHLSWLDDPKAAMPRLLFPYPRRIRRWSWRVWHRDYYAPGELLDGMSWQTYRWLNDWLEAYTATNNQLTADHHSASRFLRPDGSKRPEVERRREELKALICQERSIRLTVLSLIFGCPKWRISLARFTEPQWQVILFWWSSMMQYLKQQYPKCFKSGSPRKRKQVQSLPIELYTQSMAVLVTDLKLTEDEVNHLTAHVILRRLNTMALEAEEMEKLRNKK